MFSSLDPISTIFQSSANESEKRARLAFQYTRQLMAKGCSFVNISTTYIRDNTRTLSLSFSLSHIRNRLLSSSRTIVRPLALAFTSVTEAHMHKYIERPMNGWGKEDSARGPRSGNSGRERKRRRALAPPSLYVYVRERVLHGSIPIAAGRACTYDTYIYIHSPVQRAGVSRNETILCRGQQQQHPLLLGGWLQQRRRLDIIPKISISS